MVDLAKLYRDRVTSPVYLVGNVSDLPWEMRGNIEKAMNDRGVDKLEASDGAVIQIHKSGNIILGFLNLED